MARDMTIRNRDTELGGESSSGGTTGRRREDVPGPSMGLLCYDGGDRDVPWSFDRTQRMDGLG